MCDWSSDVCSSDLDSITLYEHATRVTSRNILAHNNLGNALAREGRVGEAETHFLEALKWKPDYAAAHNNLANVLVKQGRVRESIVHYREALRIQPELPGTRFNLESALQKVKVQQN
jgi:protein O-GlcNAc transferase